MQDTYKTSLPWCFTVPVLHGSRMVWSAGYMGHGTDGTSMKKGKLLRQAIRWNFKCWNKIQKCVCNAFSAGGRRGIETDIFWMTFQRNEHIFVICWVSSELQIVESKWSMETKALSDRAKRTWNRSLSIFEIQLIQSDKKPLTSNSKVFRKNVDVMPV